MTDTMQGLNKEQLDAVQTINGPMLILAGAAAHRYHVRPAGSAVPDAADERFPGPPVECAGHYLYQ